MEYQHESGFNQDQDQKPRRPPVVKNLNDLEIYDPRRQKEKPRTIHFGADFNGFRITSPTPHPVQSTTPAVFHSTTTTTATPFHSHSTPRPVLHEEDIKGLPAPSILLQAFGLLHDSSPTSSSPYPYQHWETSSQVTAPYAKVHYSSPLSAVKKLASVHPTPPSTTLPPGILNHFILKYYENVNSTINFRQFFFGCKNKVRIPCN